MLKDVSGFKIFEKLESVEQGCEVCLTPKVQPLSKNVNAISVWDI